MFIYTLDDVSNPDKSYVIGDVLFTADQIGQRVRELGEKISADYADECPLVITVLRGSVLFAADLVRHIDCPLEMDFLSVSSYGQSTKSSGAVKILKDLDTDVAGRDVLIVEDIIDSGLTLNYLVNYIAGQKPASIKTCSLLLRNIDPANEPPLDYYGFKIPDEFVVGYGLDYAQMYRNLPDISILVEEE